MPLHPQTQSFLDELKANPRPGWNEMPVSEAQAGFADLTDLFGEGPELERVEDLEINENVTVRIYQADPSRTSPAVMYFHGGGWVLGDIDTHDTLCRRLAEASEMTIVSVHYRRAPEHRFPAALDDCYAATQYVASHSEKLGVNGQIIVAGDSAGGNLAAAVALKARDESGPVISGQLLIYPAVALDFDNHSYHEYADGYGLTKSIMSWFWKQYLGDDLTTTDPYAVPLNASSFAGLPPAHFLLAEYDVLRSEGELYAQRLAEAGVSVSSHQYDGMLHGFIHFSGVFDVGLSAIDDCSTVLRKFVA